MKPKLAPEAIATLIVAEVDRITHGLSHEREVKLFDFILETLTSMGTDPEKVKYAKDHAQYEQKHSEYEAEHAEHEQEQSKK